MRKFQSTETGAEVTDQYIENLRNNISTLMYNESSKLMQYVDVRRLPSVTKPHPVIGTTTAQKRSGLGSDTPCMEMPLRYVQPKKHDRAYPLEATNGIENLGNPDSGCAQAVAADLGCIIDKAILEACFAEAESGDNGRHPVKFPADQIIQDDGKCLTPEKLLRAKIMLDEADGPPNDSRVIVASSQQIDNLCTATDPGSPEHKRVLALMGNDAAQFMRFNFVCMDAMIQTDNRNHLLPCFLSSGILLVYEELSARRVCERGTEKLLVELSYGAVRAKEDRVVQIACKEHP